MKRLIIILLLVPTLASAQWIGFKGRSNVTAGLFVTAGNITMASGQWIGTSQAGGWTFTSTPYIYTTSASVGIGTATPGVLLDLEKAGTAKSTVDLLELTNTVNAADMDATGTGILFNQWYYDAVTPALADIARISASTSTDWTSTASTQDGEIIFSAVKDGVMSEVVRIKNGNLGVGTTNCYEKFHLAAVGTVVQLLESTNGGIVQQTWRSGANDWLLKMDAHGGNELDFQLDGSSKLTLLITGNIGISTRTPDHLFDIAGKGNLALTGVDAGVDSTVIDSNDVRIVKEGYNKRVMFAYEGWITHDAATDTITIGVLPTNSIVMGVNIWTQEAFNSDGTDEVCVGFSGTAEAYGVDVDVSDTGVESVTLGASAKVVDATSRIVQAYYHTSDATNLTTGEAHILVEWTQATVNP